MLALRVESCSPGLLRLARLRASGDCGPSAGVLAAEPVQPSYSSSVWPGGGPSEHLRSRSRFISKCSWRARTDIWTIEETHPCGGRRVLFGSRFFFYASRSRFENPTRPSARLHGRRAQASQRVLICAERANTAGCPRPRLSHVRDRSARTLLRGVPRKGGDSRLVVSTQTPPRAADRARSHRSANI